jgi:chromosome segregation ATPase
MGDTAGQARGASASIALLAQRLETMGGSLEELKGMVKDLAGKVDSLERREDRCQAVLQMRVDQAHERLEEQKKAIVALEGWKDQTEKVIQKLQMAYGILAFVATAFGLSIIALIWGLLTGQASVVFK